jgi:hypothetical protein
MRPCFVGRATYGEGAVVRRYGTAGVDIRRTTVIQAIDIGLLEYVYDRDGG